MLRYGFVNFMKILKVKERDSFIEVETVARCWLLG